ncbi:MAG: CRISPR-associated endonuclease Cas1 [Cyanobacteria bacterium P01_E01_bin.6]
MIEEFRAPIIDSLVFYLVNRRIVHAEEDFDHQEDACYLNSSGRKKFLTAFVQRMNEEIEMPIGPMPRWHLLSRQVKEYMRWVYAPKIPYRPYLIR